MEEEEEEEAGKAGKGKEETGQRWHIKKCICNICFEI